MSRKINLNLTEKDWRSLRSVLENRDAVASAAAPDDREQQCLIGDALKSLGVCILEALGESLGDVTAAQAEPPPQKSRGRSM